MILRRRRALESARMSGPGRDSEPTRGIRVSIVKARASLACGEHTKAPVGADPAATVVAHSSCESLDKGFHSPTASESLSFASPKESNQRKGDPGIRAGRTKSVLFPAVLVNHRPANNSAIPGLKQFAFPRWSTPLLGAPAGDPKVKSESNAAAPRSPLPPSAPSPASGGRNSRDDQHVPSLPLRSGGSCPAGLKGVPFARGLKSPAMRRGEGALLSFDTPGRTVGCDRSASLCFALLCFALRRRRALDLGSPAEAPRSGAGHRGKANCLRPGMAELLAGRWPASTAGHRAGKARSARMPGSPFLWLLSFGETKESDSLAAEASETTNQNHQERPKSPATSSPPTRSKPPSKRRWIPAFAGTTFPGHPDAAAAAARQGTRARGAHR